LAGFSFECSFETIFELSFVLLALFSLARARDFKLNYFKEVNKLNKTIFIEFLNI